jgi:hypothetical protein
MVVFTPNDAVNYDYSAIALNQLVDLTVKPDEPGNQSDPAVEKVIALINALPDPVSTVADAARVAEATVEYEALTKEQKAQVPTDLKNRLAKAQTQASTVNHFDQNNSVSVSGDKLPWFVRIIVTPIPKTEPAWAKFEGKISGKKLEALFDIKLINTLTGLDYQPLTGESVNVVVDGINLPSGKKVTVFHEKQNGSIETIQALINGKKVSFKTSSFSPFGLATDPTVKTTSNNSTPTTGDMALGWLLEVAYLLIAGSVILWLWRKRQLGQK